MNKLKLEFECAVNGLEAFDKYKAAPSRYFLVLMDMNMPVRHNMFPMPDLLH
jgi:CheY-like chemotaxis protein